MNTKKVTFDELVEREARNIAKTLIEERLEKDGLPLPKDSSLDIHISHMLSIDPGLREQAKLRVEAMTDAYSESLRAIGLEMSVVKPIDIEL